MRPVSWLVGSGESAGSSTGEWQALEALLQTDCFAQAWWSRALFSAQL